MESIANSVTDGQTVRLPSALLQPIVSDAVATALARVAVATAPLNTVVDIAGPEAIPLDELVRQFLKATHDPRTVVTDEQAGYFGVPVKLRSLVPDGTPARLGATHFGAWLNRSTRDAATTRGASWHFNDRLLRSGGELRQSFFPPKFEDALNRTGKVAQCFRTGLSLARCFGNFRASGNQVFLAGLDDGGELIPQLGQFNLPLSGR